MDQNNQPAADPETCTAIAIILGIAPNLSHHTAILREQLNNNDADFQWTPSHKTAFKKTKRLICKEITLSYFDPPAETHVQVDASNHGLGPVLPQNGRSIAFASKSLSDCERRYANIKRHNVDCRIRLRAFSHLCVWDSSDGYFFSGL